MVRAFAGDSTITRRVPPPLVAALSLPLARFAAGGVLAATHSPSSPAPMPGPVFVCCSILLLKPSACQPQPARSWACSSLLGQACFLKPACPIRPCLSSTPSAGVGVPLPTPSAPRTARLANISRLPIEPPRTPRTIRGDGRLHLPRAVLAARNVT